MTVSRDTGSAGFGSATGYCTTGCQPGAWTTTRCGLLNTLGMKVTPVSSACVALSCNLSTRMRSPSGDRVTAPETEASAAAAPWLRSSRSFFGRRSVASRTAAAVQSRVEEGFGALGEGVPHPFPHRRRVREQPFREGLLTRATGLGRVQRPLRALASVSGDRAATGARVPPHTW